jgi:methyl-accepting chemotaxis protein
MPPSSRPRNVLGRLLAASFIVVVTLAMLGAILGSAALAWIDRATSAALQGSLADERLAAEVYRLVAVSAERYKAMALSSEPAVQESLSRDLRAAEGRYRQLLQQLRQRAAGGGSLEALARVEAADARFGEAAAGLRSAIDTNFTATIQQEFQQRFQPATRELLDSVDRLAAAQRAAIDAAAAGVHRQSVLARWLLGAFSMAALGVSIVLAWWLTRRISRPIAQASATAARVAGLDLAQDIHGHRRDEAGELLTALGRMQQNLRDLVVQVSGSANGLHLAAGEMAQGNRDLASRTEETASSLDRTAEALDHVTRGLGEASQALGRASEHSNVAAAGVVQGGELVARLVERMRGIEQHGARVAEIVSVMDGIAFQTNLLALNAAVEAARAGVHGRGFAVVAAEVRQLSRRSAEAAQEVRALIAQSIASVRAGVTLADQAGEVVASGVRAMQEVAADLRRIVAHTQSQASEIQGVNTAMARVSDATQQNAALVEQSSAAAQQLRGEAESLSGLISRFVLPEEALRGAPQRLLAGER